jgi:hypothetical protein
MGSGPTRLKMASVAPGSIPRMRSADFYRILFWPIKLGKSRPNQLIRFRGCEARALFAVGVAGTGAAIGERRAIWRTSLALVLLKPLG